MNISGYESDDNNDSPNYNFDDHKRKSIGEKKINVAEKKKKNKRGRSKVVYYLAMGLDVIFQ